MIAMIQLQKINKIYTTLSGRNVHALKDIDLSIQEGEKVVVIGKSGSGKSTLLNILSGIDRPDSGEIIISGQPLSNLSETKLSKWRGNTVGIVFQFFQLFPTLSAIDNILFAMELVNKIPGAQRKERAKNLLADVGLGNLMYKFPNELSGGEIQRVAVARSLANDPSIIIADEPTGNLDSQTGEQIYQLFNRLHKKGKTIIIVTHEDIAGRNFDQIIHIRDGILQKVKVS